MFPVYLSETVPNQGSLDRKPLILLVGVAGFEPATPSSRTTRPTPKSLTNNARYERKDREHDGNIGQ
jgi:hypothetical protein